MSDLVDPQLVQGPDIERLKEIVKCEILGPFGMDSFEVIQNMHTPIGFQKMMSTPLWKMWKCLREWKDDALPEFGPFEIDEQKEGMVFWDLHLTNYSHDLSPHLLKEKGSGA